MKLRLIVLAVLTLAIVSGPISVVVAETGYTYFTSLEPNEDIQVVCFDNDLVFYHPPRTDGTPDTRKIVLECKPRLIDTIWIEGVEYPVDSPFISPLTVPQSEGHSGSTKLYLGLILTGD